MTWLVGVLYAVRAFAADDDVPSASASEAAAAQPTAARRYVGLGLVSPDALPFEGLRREADGRSGWRVFLAPPVKLRIREGQGAEEESYFGTVKVATPATTVDAEVTLGPVLGAEYLRFPLGTDWFVAGGLSLYQARAVADKATPVLICFDTTVACTSATASYRTNSELEVHAVARERGVRARVSTGWLWDVGESAYVSFTAVGLAKILYVKRDVDVSASFDDDPGMSELANEQVQYVLPAKEDKARDKAKARMRKYDRDVLPIVGLTAGVSF